MQKTIENLIKVLELRSKTANCEFSIYDDCPSDIQVSFWSTSIPLLSDIRCIVSAFVSNMFEIIHVNNDFGFIEIYVSDGRFNDKEDYWNDDDDDDDEDDDDYDDDEEVGEVDVEDLELYIASTYLDELRSIK